MTENDDHAVPKLASILKALAHQGRADSAILKRGQHGHRRQRERGPSHASIRDRQPREEDVPDDLGPLLRNQTQLRDETRTQAQCVHEGALGRPAEGRVVHLTNGRVVSQTLRPDRPLSHRGSPPCMLLLGVICLRTLPPEITQRSSRTHRDQGSTVDGNPMEASAQAKESSIRALCMGRKIKGHVTMARPCIAILSVCRSTALPLDVLRISKQW